MNSSTEKKEKYSKRKCDRKKYDGLTISHLLLLHQPRFLELKETWVDNLIQIEIEDKNNMTNPLAYLFKS